MRTRKMTMHASPTRMLGLLAGLMLAVPAAAEPDISWGGELFAENCSECHMVPHDDDWFKARADAGNMGSYDSLRTQVQGCANNFGLPWFDEEVEAVTAWLNQEYYDFE
ncbi:cytochrome c [Guyparkeria sp. SCN-R1]|uniref:cytochrome c n=1 Tax=Guyparkeria sp. SCN-R1 TaxID=2341113 RepID=UPI000F6495B9|nr:cytochrome c [Guyparkeria sp. SCN-R1]